MPPPPPLRICSHPHLGQIIRGRQQLSRRRSRGGQDPVAVPPSREDALGVPGQHGRVRRPLEVAAGGGQRDLLARGNVEEAELMPAEEGVGEVTSTMMCWVVEWAGRGPARWWGLEEEDGRMSWVWGCCPGKGAASGERGMSSWSPRMHPLQSAVGAHQW
jgi:hypothetical protein